MSFIDLTTGEGPDLAGESSDAPRNPFAHRGGTVMDPERALTVHAKGPKGPRPHGLLDKQRGVYQCGGDGWAWLDSENRRALLPIGAWLAVRGHIARIEFVDHADNRVLVVTADVIARESRVVAGPHEQQVAIPLECCALWAPPADRVISTGDGPQRDIAAQVDEIVPVPSRPALPSHRILLDAGPSERGWHHAQTMLRCPQLYAYRYLIENMDVTRRPPLIKGSLVHIGLAHHYARLQAQQLRADPEQFFTPDEAIQLLAGRYGDHWGEWIELAQSAVAAYQRTYARERYRVLQIEEQLRCTIGGHVFTQRVDLVLQDRATGRVSYQDHKTTGRVTKKSVHRYTLSGQFLGLIQFGWALHPNQFSGAQVNLVGLTTPHKFLRKHPDPAPHALACFPQAIVDAEEDIERLTVSGREAWFWPKRLNEQICNTIYGDCDGHDFCRFGPPEPPES